MHQPLPRPAAHDIGIWAFGRWSWYGLSVVSFVVSPVSMLCWFLVGVVLGLVLIPWLPWLPGAMERVAIVVALGILAVLFIQVVLTIKIVIPLSTAAKDWRTAAKKNLKSAVTMLQNAYELIDDEDTFPLDRFVHLQTSALGAIISVGITVVQAHTEQLYAEGKITDLPRLLARVRGFKDS